MNVDTIEQVRNDEYGAYIDAAVKAALDGGADEAWAELFDASREIGVAFQKAGKRYRAFRSKLPVRMAEITDFVRAY